MESEKVKVKESLKLSHTFEELIDYLSAVHNATSKAGDHLTLSYVDDILTVVQTVSLVSTEEGAMLDTERKLAMSCMVGVRADLKHPN